jgi:hypothetical protein|tara:strand:+ start:270 stop:725 length:456 start_codon:yes stop_codon:yes gene_type:complete
MIIYSNITRDTTLTGNDALRDIFKKHWANAVKLYEQHGYDILSARNVTVCASSNTESPDMNVVSGLLVDYDVIYFNHMMHHHHEHDAPMLSANAQSFDNFVCEYSVFFRLMSNWREITTMLDQPNHLFFLSRILEYQNITVRQSDFLKVNE